MKNRLTRALLPALLLIAACERGKSGGCAGDNCGTLVFSAIGQPVTLLPPVADAALDRDIFDQIFLKLADIGASGNTVGDKDFVPLLADRWSWTDSLDLAFHIDPRAKWQDGRKVTAQDVAFTFTAMTDSSLDSGDRSSLAPIASVTATDSATATFKFKSRYPEMFFDAVYHLRVLPAHLLTDLPYPRWRTAEFGHAPVGDGPYRFVKWTPGQSLELAADTTFFLGRPHVRRLIWKFAADLSVAVTQVIAGDADAIEVLVSPPNIERAKAAPQLTLYPYAGSVYMIARFNLAARGSATQPHPIFGDPEVRRALVLATDRVRMAQSVFGTAAKVPPAPIPQLWGPLWFHDMQPPAPDTAQAARLLEQRGWHDSNGDGIRDKGGRKLSFALMVPGTSAARKQYARLVQEQLRAVGVEVTIDEMDMPTLQQKLHAGQFDAAIEAWNNDPTPTSGIPQMWRRGGGSNFGHYANPAFDALADSASHAASAAAAEHAWHRAFEILNTDAPAIVLAAPDNVAAIHKRVADVHIRPDEYWALVRGWRIPTDKLIDRDRLER